MRRSITNDGGPEHFFQHKILTRQLENMPSKQINLKSASLVPVLIRPLVERLSIPAAAGQVDSPYYVG